MACPICKYYPLDVRISKEIGGYRDEEIFCISCGKTFDIISGIPVMLPDFIGRNLSSRKRSWRKWSNKLQNFIEWRRLKWNVPQAQKFKIQRNELYHNFFSFCELLHTAEGYILDIGCGDGVVRSWLGESCIYVGIDPLPIPSMINQFRMVQGVGERLPFRDGIFDHVIIMQTLDHCFSSKLLISEAMRVLKRNGSVNISQLINRPRKRLPWKTRMKKKVKAILLDEPFYDPCDSKTYFYSKATLTSLVNNYFHDIKSETVIMQNQTFLHLRAKIIITAQSWHI